MTDKFISRVLGRIIPVFILAAGLSVSTLYASDLPTALDDERSLSATPKPESYDGLSPIEFAPNLLRGPRPEDETKLRQWVRDHGITKIIAVDDFHDDEYEGRREKVWAEAAGVQFVHYPMHHYMGPSAAQLSEALEHLLGQPGQRVYVHCKYGMDRTGFVVAAYRMAVENSSAEEALREAYEFGHSGFLFFWDPVLVEFERSLVTR